MKKPGRNDPCHCGSGKKFKKCCESKMIRGRFMATPLKDSTLSGRNLMDLGALFQAHVGPSRSEREEVKSEQTLEVKEDVLVTS